MHIVINITSITPRSFDALYLLTYSGTMNFRVFQVDGIAIGFMSICKDVNLDLLNRCFELGPFHGLHVPHPDDVTHPVVSQPEPDVGPGDNDDLDEGNDRIMS